LKDQVFFSAFFNQFGQRAATPEDVVTDRKLLVSRILQLAPLPDRATAFDAQAATRLRDPARDSAKFQSRS
jgi:hypothetical protein